VTDHQPHRGDAIDQWLKARRDSIHPNASAGDQAAWWALDDAINDYRDHADTGVPLGQEIAGPEAGRA
jgi:hypothetical protein